MLQIAHLKKRIRIQELQRLYSLLKKHQEAKENIEKRKERDKMCYDKRKMQRNLTLTKKKLLFVSLYVSIGKL